MILLIILFFVAGAVRQHEVLPSKRSGAAHVTATDSDASPSGKRPRLETIRLTNGNSLAFKRVGLEGYATESHVSTTSGTTPPECHEHTGHHTSTTSPDQNASVKSPGCDKCLICRECHINGMAPSWCASDHAEKGTEVHELATTRYHPECVRALCDVVKENGGGSIHDPVSRLDITAEVKTGLIPADDLFWVGFGDGEKTDDEDLKKTVSKPKTNVGRQKKRLHLVSGFADLKPHVASTNYTNGEMRAVFECPCAQE